MAEKANHARMPSTIATVGQLSDQSVLRTRESSPGTASDGDSEAWAALSEVSYSSPNLDGGISQVLAHSPDDLNSGVYTTRTDQVLIQCPTRLVVRAEKVGRPSSRPQSRLNRARQPVMWVPPTAPESAIKRTSAGAEQRARTTAAGRRGAAQNGTSGGIAHAITLGSSGNA